jgi:putative phosphoserine phosphatase/1-acylglycerol-3-phosphate O-acyltransferase
MQEKIIAVYRAGIAFTLMTGSGLLAMLLRIFSFGLLTEFNRRYLIPSSSRLILLLIGIRFKLPPPDHYPREQVMYTFNHNSFLDVLLITALGIPNTRVILSEKTLKLLPVTISAMSIGTLYIPLKTKKERRMRFFIKLREQMDDKKYSVIASSEGVHLFRHGIAPFNKGIYHVAKQCSMTIVPLYLHIPEKSNPFESYRFSNGTVRVDILPSVSTAGWELDKLKQHVAGVRKMYIEKYSTEHKL